MSQNLQDLCCALVADIYGSFHARLFSELAHHRRLNLTQIAQKCRLSTSKVKSGLAALVSLRLVQYHTTPEGNTTFGVNFQTAYDLVRSGKLIRTAEKEHGTLAATIITHACDLGYATFSEIRSRVQATDTKLGDLLPGSHELDSSQWTSDEIDAVTRKLINERYLINLRTAHFQSDFDVRQDAERYCKHLGYMPKTGGTKAKAEFEERLDGEVWVRQDTVTAENGHFEPARDLSRKRPFADDGEVSSAKRLKGDTANAQRHTNGHSEYPKTLLRVNHQKVVSSVRDEFLAASARKIFGNNPAMVLEAALMQIPASTLWHRDQPFFDLDLHLLEGHLNRPPRKAAYDNHREQSNGSKVNGLQNGHTVPSFTDDDVDRNLAILAEGPYKFLYRNHQRGSWSIAKLELDSFILQQELLRLMSSKTSGPALRILRMMREKGKLEEKTLQEKSLLGAKELRQMLSQLKQLGYIDLQEVPREAQRQPNRSMFLWFSDTERVRKLLLENIYKAMTRLMQRTSLERDNLSVTLEKAQRDDVRGKEEEMLSPAEFNVLRRWQKQEQWLLGEINRLDNSVAVLRDL